MRILKWLLRMVLGLIFLGFVGTFLIAHFVNPLQFKGVIEQNVSAHTGHSLLIQGPLSWRVFPMLSLQLENVYLKNQEPFKEDLLSANLIQAECSPWSLLTGKVFLNLKMQGLILNLQKTEKGTTNWEALRQRLTPSGAATSSQPSRFLLNGIQINDSQVQFHDQQKNERYALSNVSLEANHLIQGALGARSSLTLKGALASHQRKMGEIHLNSDWDLSLSTQAHSLNSVKLEYLPVEGLPLLLKGEALIRHLDQKPSIEGKLEMPELEPLPLLSALNISSPDFMPKKISLKTDFSYLEHNLTLPNLELHLNKKGFLSIKTHLNFSNPGIKTVTLEGQVNGQHLELGSLTVETLKGQFQGRGGVFNFSPLHFKVANVSQEATLQINLQETIPQFRLTQNAQSFEINDLLTALGSPNQVKGKAQSYLNLRASGYTLNDWQKSLHGKAELRILEGKVYGIDFISLTKMAQQKIQTLLNGFMRHQKTDFRALLSVEEAQWKPSPKAYTPFNEAKGAFTFENGLARNPSLSITHTEYEVKGQGTYNLATTDIQYQLSVLLKKNPYPSTDAIAQFLYKTPLSLHIEGPLQTPRIHPDIKAYSNAAFRYAQTHLMNQAVERGVESVLKQLIK